MIFLVGIGGALGAVARFVLGKWITSKSSTSFPLGTLIINISGSFLLGFLFHLHSNELINNTNWALFATGFLGSYTTFSTFSFEAVSLFINGNRKQAILYITSSIFASIFFAWLGMTI